MSPATRLPVVVVGAGPGGLAMSHHLTGAGIEHVVLERGQVGNSWRTERWDSLRLLTPNWMTALPGFDYDGDDPDGFMTAADVVSFLDAYRAQSPVPLRVGVTVESITRTDAGFDVRTTDGRFECRAVVAATGASSCPRIPDFASELPRHIDQLTALEYRRPAQLAAGGDVLVVGASSSGVQIADELTRAGRSVTIAVGEHVRLPRCHRGRDIYWWLDRIGQLDERHDEVEDVERARRHASVQVVGSADRRDLDLNAVHAGGTTIVGRLMAVRGGVGLCSGSLGALVQNADLKQARLLRRIDEFVNEHDLDGAVGPPSESVPTMIPTPPTELRLESFSTVVWATGYRPRNPWLPAEAFTARGRIAHDGGIAALPGLYFLGLPFMRRRRSNLISGIARDAADLAGHLHAFLDPSRADRVTVSTA